MSTNKISNTASQKLASAYVNNNSNKQPPHPIQPQQQLHQPSHHHPSQLPQLQPQHIQKLHSSSQLPSPSVQSPSTAVQSVQKSQPPRYQPPPPPGGILKHIPGVKSGIPTFVHHSPHSADANSALHLNIKYPPDVPKLTTVYIPESVRNTGNSSRRPLQQRQSLNNIQQHIASQASPRLAAAAEDEQTQQEQLSAANRPVRCRVDQLGPTQEMLKFVRKSDADSVASTSTANASTSNAPVVRMSAAEQNRQLQTMIAELRALKEANQRLSDDNQELRDLCCFLDDDRQKGRKLAREWQRFGRYTASVMRQEVSAYQSKLRELDDKQQELIRDNLELKELCLYLDEERANVTASLPTTCTNCGAPVRPVANTTSGVLRDDGDGSSSSTNDEPMPTTRQFDRAIPELNIRSTLSDQTLQYVRSLERRILEHELTNINANSNNGGSNSTAAANNANSNTNNNNNNNNNNNSSNEILSGRPEAVVRALQILEVREQLERDRARNSPSISPEHMDDGEKALLREMCNVVWRKLEENPNGPGIDPL